VVLGVAFARLPFPRVVGAAFLLFVRGDSDGEAAVVLAGGGVATGDVVIVVSAGFVIALVVVASVVISVVAVLFGFWIHSVQVTSSSLLPTCSPHIM
jgi:hypothetical protein